MTGLLTGQIPFPALCRFADRYGIDDEAEFDQFIHVVRRLDAFVVSDLNVKANKK